jgi:Xaa-Pro aminopeptidase
MEKHHLDAYLIPGSDAHQNEYVPDCWKRREFITGFTGSAGDVVILKEKAGLWTDSRYFLQAEEQLKGSGIDLFKIGVPGTPTIEEFLLNELSTGTRVGMDASLFTHSQFTQLKNILRKKNIDLISVEPNLVDEIWKDQPPLPNQPVIYLDETYSGESHLSKIEKIREKMKKEDGDGIIFSTLDSIAWILNVRGKDIEYNPVVISYLVVTDKNVFWFVEPEKVPNAVQEKLGKEIEILPYSSVFEKLPTILSKDAKVLLDPNQINQRIYEIVEKNSTIHPVENPVDMMKGIKNQVEIRGFRNAHIRDGVAMVKFLYWLDQHVYSETITELDAERKLEEFRSQQELYQGPSFRTIAAFGEHGAIVHYAADESSNAVIRPDGIFLLDSGGQYLDGTTDITRTIAIGNPTHEQKEMFTLVLKGMIDLTITPFPYGTVGKQLDTIARLPLWQHFKNYGHGTGHGLGHFLNVHEGPHAISYYRCKGVPLYPGMISSNEPGYYKTGEFGIRIENIVVVEDDGEMGDFHFLKFDTLTLCPIDLKLVDSNLLTNREKNFLNAYHERVYETLSPFLNEDEKNWLANATRKI